MAGRSSRSPARLRAASPSSSRIEDLLYMNMHSPTPRAQRLSNPPNYPPSRRSLYSPLPLGHPSAPAAHGDGVVGNGVLSSRSTSVMSTRRSASSSVVPRIVRGTFAGREPPAPSSHASGAVNDRLPPSPSRARRPSGSAAAAAVPLPNTHRTTSMPSSTSTAVPPPSHVVSFPRPSYLEHSAFRYCLQSEPNAGETPDLYRFSSFHASAVATGSRRSHDLPSPVRDSDSDEDSNGGRGDRGQTVPPPHLAPRRPLETFMHLPTRWSDADRCPSLSVSADGRELTFHGTNSSGEKDAAAARTNCPIPAACGIYYYEIEILNKGQKGHISIGFGTGAVRLSRLPGWEGQSWGYHGDDGNSFASEREGSLYGPKFTTGDIVGCGIDYSSGHAFFTKNGRYLGPVFEKLSSAGQLYPTVGLRTPGEAIRANFGHEPFTFDIDSHVEQMRNQTWATIQSSPVAWSVRSDAGTFVVSDRTKAASSAAGTGTSRVGSDSSTEVSKPMNELILAYLAHHGYVKTARAFKTQCDCRSGIVASLNAAPLVRDHTIAMDTDGDEATPVDASEAGSSGINQTDDGAGLGGAGTALLQSDTLLRQKIVNSIVDGDIDTALEETREKYPSVLEREGGIILFKLRCRKFVELVLEAAAAWRKMKEEEVKGKAFTSNGTTIPDAESMDVDDDDRVDGPVINGNSTVASPPDKPRAKVPLPLTSVSSSKTPSQIVLEHALVNGQSLQADYKSDTRPEVQAIYKRTLSLVAYDDPLADDSSVPEAVKEIAGQGARDHLAEEVNRAILESQGRPPHPVLERLYRHTQACVMQLGWQEVGAAAFADMPKEFLDA